MIEKKNIVNYLFVGSFSVYGIGSYISALSSPSLGYLISSSLYLIITIFYIVDLLYRNEFQIRVNAWYLVMVVFLISSVISLFISLYKHLPESNLQMTITKSFLLIIPFQAFIAVRMYNEDERLLMRLTLVSLSLFLFINLVGYFGLGINNQLHSIEGRISFPFIDGFYSGSCLLAIINLILLSYFQAAKKNVIALGGWFLYFGLNLVLLFLINSRLTLLIFLAVIILFVFKAMGKVKIIYVLALLTLPILLNAGSLIYNVLNQQIFISLLQRVDVIDITTFNGRAFLWQDAFDWLFHDQRGLLFGNGYRGHYFLNMISEVAQLWNVKELQHLHLHSTALEVLIGQGLVGYVAFFILFYAMFRYYSDAYSQVLPQGLLLPVVIFLLFISQVDTFLYMESLGLVIFAWLLSAVVIKQDEVHLTKGDPKTTLL